MLNVLVSFDADFYSARARISRCKIVGLHSRPLLGEVFVTPRSRVKSRQDLADLELSYLRFRGFGQPRRHHTVGHGMRIGHGMLDALLSIGLPNHEAARVFLAVGRHTEAS